MTAKAATLWFGRHPVLHIPSDDPKGLITTACGEYQVPRTPVPPGTYSTCTQCRRRQEGGR